MKNKILTISVAAYNLEKLIEDNLKSFVNSKVNDFIEVIVTDDGSKDKTTEIVEKYANEYPNTIKLVKQPNAGPGSTVNSGIEHATGKYFKMVDGDDWVETENLNILVNKLKSIDADIIITNYEVFDESKNRIIETKKCNLENEKILKFDDICSDLHLDMHNVTYRTAILKENNIKLDNGFYTDVEYLLLPTKYISSAIYFDLDIYVYRIARAGQSVSLASMQRNINMHNLVLIRLIKYYEDNKENITDNLKKYLSNRIGDMADTQLMTMLTFKINSYQKKKVKKYFKDLENSSPDIYQKFIRGKKERILLLTNFILIKQIAKIIIKKF